MRSLYIDCGPATAMQALATQSDAIGSGALVLSLHAEGENVLVGLQPVSKTKTALHIVLADNPIARRAERQHAVAVWAAELRRSLEEGKGTAAKLTLAHEAAP